VTEPLLHDLDVHSPGDEIGCGAVPHPVQGNRWQAAAEGQPADNAVM
jgi:hypothetical protein